MTNTGTLSAVSFVIRHSFVLLAFLSMPAGASPASEWQFSDVERIVAISDVHGAYDAMVATLGNAGVIDENLAWSGGLTHLVITGDLLDRGPDSRRVMDLIMRLENESLAAGGRVHQLIGNHEAMNLVGDLRYVSLSEYAAFTADELPEERERWFEYYRAKLPLKRGKEELRAAFDKLAPPGFFGHRRAFRANGHYGKWLLEKPLMVVINGTAFVHGGISPYVAEHGLAGVNNTLKDELRRYVTELGVLEDHSILSPTDSFYDHVSLLKKHIKAGQTGDEIRESVDFVMELNDSEIHDRSGPLWYRGTVGCGDLIESDRLNAALVKIGATRAVIGHTPTLTRRVLQRLGGRVIEIDTGMLSASYKGSGNALILEGNSLTVVNESGTSTSQPIEHPRRVGHRSQSISAEDLTEILSVGTITSLKKDILGPTVVKFDVNGATISAKFAENPRRKDRLPLLAAYKLDRLLGLDMIPVTVRREVGGKRGTLQFSPTSSKTEIERAKTGRGGSAWCSLSLQWNTMYIFDSLIFNTSSSQKRMLYSLDNWQLMLVQHDQSFGLGKGRPKHLRNIKLDINGGWVSALGRLSDDVLQDNLGDVLDKRQLAALGKRRDRLIKDAGHAVH